MNPFEPPQTPKYIGKMPYGFDGDQLVVTSGKLLPNICVITGQSLEPADCSWCDIPWPFFLGPVIRKNCRLSYGISPIYQRSYHLRKVLIRTYRVVLYLTFAFAIGLLGWSQLVPWIGLVLLLLNIWPHSIPTEPLRIARYEDGKFWIDGVSEAGRLAIEAYMHSKGHDDRKTFNNQDLQVVRRL
ncbi:MAG: hypothetical protein U0930_16810 [Pirellulales bacterium]